MLGIPALSRWQVSTLPLGTKAFSTSCQQSNATIVKFRGKLILIMLEEI